MINQANWITRQENSNGQMMAKHGGRPPFFRKVFYAGKPCKNVSLQITSLGVFKAYINGKEIDNDYFMPGWTDYNLRVNYVTYDITKFIKEMNILTVIVADGWYAGNIGYGLGRLRYGETLSLIASIAFEYEDGSTESILTDKSWMTADGQIIYSDIFNGEYIDGRIQLSGCSDFEEKNIDWEPCILAKMPECVLEPMTCESIRSCEELTPEIIYSKSNISRYNFRQNFAGVVRVKIKGERNTKITICHSEMLKNNGELYTDNLREASATDYYICSGEGTETIQPLFTFHGFQYAQISIEGNAEIIDVAGISLHSDLMRTGYFTCSNELVNQIFSNTLWGQRSNFLSIPTDCPQRDERLGWTGDAQIFCTTAMYNMNCKLFFEKYLLDVRDSQQKNGAIYNFVPTGNVHDSVDTVGSPIWGDCITIIPYDSYLMYGDKKVITDNLAAAKRWVDFCYNRSDNGLCKNVFSFGDWLSLEETNKDVLATAYIAYSAYITSKMCLICEDDATSIYFKIYENAKIAFRRNFVSTDFKIEGDTQTAYLIAYAFGLMTKDEISKHLLRKLEQSGFHLTTGFVGVKYLLPVLCDIGKSEIAYELIAKTTYPSWGYSVVNGATTIWERWDSFTIKDGFKADGMNSFNHYTLGSCVEWIYSYALGIKPCEDMAGFKELLVKPYLNNQYITSAKGSFATRHGDIDVCWKFSEGIYIYEITIPKGIIPRFYFEEYDILQSSENEGKHTFLLQKISCQ